MIYINQPYTYKECNLVKFFTLIVAFRSHIATRLVVVLLVGSDRLRKSLRLRRFKLDRGEIWHECFVAYIRAWSIIFHSYPL